MAGAQEMFAKPKSEKKQYVPLRPQAQEFDRKMQGLKKPPDCFSY